MLLTRKKNLEYTKKGENHMAKRVTVIGASAERNKLPEQKRLKVCGYARVSTGSSAQAGSYAAQVEYYTNKIQSNPL